MKFFYFLNSNEEIEFSEDNVEYKKCKIIEIYDSEIKNYNCDMINFKKFKINKEIFTKMREKKVFAELNSRDIINYINKGQASRVQAFVKALISYNVPYKFNCRVNNKYEFKSPKEIMLLGEHLGLTQQQVKGSLRRDVRGD